MIEVSMPGDLEEARVLAQEIAGREGIPVKRAYGRLRNWWLRGRVRQFQRKADLRTYLSRAEVDAMMRIGEVDRDSPG